MSFLQTPVNVAKHAIKQMMRNTYLRQAVYNPDKSQRPFLVRLDINNTCNQLCKSCFYPEYLTQQNSPHYISLEEFEILADRLFEYAYFLQIPCAFEPLLHPNFSEIVKIIDRYNIPNVGLVTNGTLLTEEIAASILDAQSVTAIAISLDAITPETYRLIRGKPHLDIVLHNIRQFMQLRKDSGKDLPNVLINTMIMHSNLSELPMIMKWCVENKVGDVQFFHVQPMEKENSESLVSEPEAYNLIHDEIGTIARNTSVRLFLPPPFRDEDFEESTGTYNFRHYQNKRQSDFDTSYSNRFDQNETHPYPDNVFCICPWMTLVIDCQGNLSCCAHRANEPVGNIIRQKRENALNSYKIMKLRREMLQGNHGKVCPFCRATTPGSDPMKRKLTRSIVSDG